MNVGERVLDRVPHSCLRRQIYNTLRLVRGERGLNCRPISKIHTQMRVSVMVRMPGQSCFFEGWIVVVVMIVDTDNVVSSLKQAKSEGGSDKAGRPSDKNFHAALSIIESKMSASSFSHEAL